ncbi:MAG: J domain-containing protein [Caulobacteraceae bacterium]|nr:J domain-containing protein [Caulobacteraceae bacterium]
MSGGSIWAVLGIAQTNDRTEIRRAYSRRLKVTHPEDDAEGFKALREAYEHAMALAARGAAIQQAQVPEPAPAPEPVESVREPELAAADGQAAPRAEPEPAPQPAQVLWADQGDAERHRLTFRRLQTLVETRTGDPAPVLEAFEALLASPAMDSVSVQEQTEVWIMFLILNNPPLGDVLIEPAIERFGWDHSQIGPRFQPRDAVLARREDLRALEAIKRTTSPHHRAFVALTRKPKGWKHWLDRATLGLPDEIAALLQIAHNQHRGLLLDFDPEAVVWWQAYLSKPQFSPAAIWTAAIAPAVAAASLVQSQITPETPLGLIEAYGAALAGTLGILAAWLYALARPQARWRETWRWSAPIWAKLGWAPASLSVLALAALIPPSPIATIALAVLGFGVAAWAYITGWVDQRPARRLASWISGPVAMVLYLFGRDMPWRMRALLSFAPLALFWRLIAKDLPTGAWGQMTLPLAAAAATFVFGCEPLAEAWHRDLTPPARRIALAAFGLAVALTPLVLWWVAPGPALTPAAATLVAILVLLHKVPTAHLEGRAYAIRDLLMRFGWIVWTALLAIATEYLRQGDATLLTAGLWLLTGVAAGIAGALRAERLTPQPAR